MDAAVETIILIFFNLATEVYDCDVSWSNECVERCHDTFEPYPIIPRGWGFTADNCNIYNYDCDSNTCDCRCGTWNYNCNNVGGTSCCDDRNTPAVLYNGSVAGMFSLSQDECEAHEWYTGTTSDTGLPSGCLLQLKFTTNTNYYVTYNTEITTIDCGIRHTSIPPTWRAFCLERYQVPSPKYEPPTRGNITNGNIGNCTILNHDEYCRIQCNPGYYIIDGIGGNDLCWAGGFTGQSEFGNTYKNSSCAVCPTGRYTTQLNSVTQCNTFSYYINGSARDGDTGQLCGDGYHFIAGNSSTDSQCIQCSAGTYSTGGDACQACPVGQQAQNSNNNNEYSSGGASYCVTCQDGSDNQDGGECDRCPVGEYSVNGANCSVCGDGKQAQLSTVGHVFATLNDIFTEHTSGTSDNSMTPSECSTYAGSGFYSSSSWGHIPYGCVRQQSTGNTYWNSNTNSQVGCAGGPYGACVKKTSSGGAPYCVTCQDGYDNQDNGICDACPIAQNSTGGAECTACPKGTQAQMNNDDNVFNTGTGSPYCVTCEAGKDNENGGECDPCPSGLISMNGAKCDTCPVGTQAQALNTGHEYSSSGALYCVTCQAGYDNEDGGACDPCPDGLVSINGAKCGTCPVGTQSQALNTGNVYDSSGALYCITCADGYDNQDGNACEACPEGEYSVGGANCSVCGDGKQSQTSDSDNVFVNSAATKCITCADGYDNQDGGECEACPEGEYSVGGANCSVCTDGKQAQTSDINTIFVDSAATKCVTCQDGYDNQDGNACEACPIGEYSTNGANCHICDDGKQAQLYDTGHIFNNGTGSPYCVACQDGYDNQNGNACDACPIGEYSTGGADCITCPVGRFTKDTNSTSCDLCPPGRYMQQTSSTREEADCIPCPAGYYSGVSGLNDLANANPCNACPLGTWSPTFDSTDTDNPNHPNPPSAESHCRSCPAGTKGVTTALGSESECTSCDPGDESSEPNPTHCTQCDIGTFSEGREVCRSCPENTFQPEKGQDECLTTITKCNPGQEVILGNVTHPASCLDCNASYHYSPDGITCRDKKTSCMKGFGIQSSGNAVEDDFCTDVYGFEHNEPEDNEVNELYWTTMSIYCAKRGKFALLTNGRLVCAPCSNKLFLYEYEMSNDYIDIETLPASQRASRHGKCCVNPHHKICVKMMDEYHRNCKAELKGTTQIQLQPCDIDPTGDGCPPYIAGPSVLDLYVDEKLEQMISFYNCFNGNGGSSYNWIDIYGSVPFGFVGTYHIHLSCTEVNHGGDVDAVPLSVMVNVIDRPTGVHKVVTFDNQQHYACSYDTIEVNWNGNDMNLYEVDVDGYNTCSGGLIGDEIESEMNSVHSEVYVIGPEVGNYRYYVANNIINVNGGSTTPCAEYGKKFMLYCPIPPNRGTLGVPVNNTLY